ncbi:MAG TPA: hypothetical protein DEB40_07885 [Elusimicrobia bacterium]|nr:hypothetical protein [Elusimicrobiota bacterium]HBT61649.1 hypothetical protein [Elusimicrobiota bacterium]
MTPLCAWAGPVLNFSDIVSGPQTGNTDGAGGLSSSQHGSIVTVWGNNLGLSQGGSQVYIKDAFGQIVPAAHIYYWKTADGQLPGGPADLATYHKMQEISFSIPAAASAGSGELYVLVSGAESNHLPFLIRPGRIYFVRSGGSDTAGNGSFSNAYGSVPRLTANNTSPLLPGDIVYVDGVAATTGLKIGISDVKYFAGTETAHHALIAYPGSRCNISGIQSGSSISNFYGRNSYWDFSKLSINTAGTGIYVFKDMRVVANNITGPTADGYGGAVSGSNGGQYPDGAYMDQAQGAKLYGNHIHHFGSVNSSVFHHLFYISNRCGSPARPFEIAWTHAADNDVYQGLHIYDQAPCGDWSGVIKIHHNVVKNQRGNSFNFNAACAITTPVEVYENLFINDDYAYGERAISVTPSATTSNIKIYNNTIYGYNASNAITHGGSFEFKNNILIDTKNLPYFTDTGTTCANRDVKNNLFYSLVNPSLAGPSWALDSLHANPLLDSDFALTANSPAKNAGTATHAVYNDLRGNPLPLSFPSLGALEYAAASSASNKFFSTSFEDVNDWIMPRPPKNATGYGWEIDSGTHQPPKKLDGTQLFDLFRVGATLFDPPHVTPAYQIGNGLGRSGGRGLLYNVEVSGIYDTTGWTGGTPLGVWLGTDGRHDLYVRFYAKYPSHWKWNDTSVSPNTGAIQKIVRIARFNGTPGNGKMNGPYAAPPYGEISPVWVPTWFRYISVAPSYSIFYEQERYAPNYTLPTTQDFFTNFPQYYPAAPPILADPPGHQARGILWPSDGDWHCYELHAKMNSAPGAADGISELWIDGVKLWSKKTIPWVMAGGSVTNGWNIVNVLDNADLTSFKLSDQVTLPMYLDDIVIGAAYSGPPAPPVSVSGQITGPGKARISWMAGTNGDVFKLDGYRVYYGTSPTSLNNCVSAAGTALDISGLQAGKTYYFSVSAFNKGSYDANENESLRSLPVSIAVPETAPAGVVFSDNFDDSPDWYVKKQNQVGACVEGVTANTCAVPGGWTHFRTDEKWNPYGGTPGSHPVIQISGEQHYGPGGKAYVQWNESHKGNSGDGWGADGIIGKALDKDYSELYVQYKTRFMPGFKRFWTPNANAGFLKTFRVSHWDRIGSPFQAFEAGALAPIMLYDANENEWPPYGFASSAFRCDPQATNYYCSGVKGAKSGFVDASGQPITGWSANIPPSTDDQRLGIFDGNWHTIEHHVKLNSAPGVSDGIYQYWYDGYLLADLSNVQWIGAGGNINAGWNWVALGGNAFNNYMNITDSAYQPGAEQWYAIDDVIVSTQYIKNAGTPATSRAPDKPKGFRIVP